MPNTQPKVTKLEDGRYVVSFAHTFTGEVPQLITIAGVQFYAYPFSIDFSQLGLNVVLPGIRSVQVATQFVAYSDAASQLFDGELVVYSPSTGQLFRICGIAQENYEGLDDIPSSIITSVFSLFTNQNGIVQFYRFLPDAPNLPSVPPPIEVTCFTFDVPPATISGVAHPAF